MAQFCILGLILVLGSIVTLTVSASMLSSQISDLVDDGEFWE